MSDTNTETKPARKAPTYTAYHVRDRNKARRASGPASASPGPTRTAKASTCSSTSAPLDGRISLRIASEKNG